MMTQAGYPRIIPAYAGSTSKCRSNLSLSSDHPRVCGEHLDEVALALARDGSSPRMRGAHRAIMQRRSSWRIIPAYAGSTLDELEGLVGVRDHPRVCGEHESPSRSLFARTGSSPRMRGARCLIDACM